MSASDCPHAYVCWKASKRRLASDDKFGVGRMGSRPKVFFVEVKERMIGLTRLMEIVDAVKKLPRYGSNYEVVVGVGAKLNTK